MSQVIEGSNDQTGVDVVGLAEQLGISLSLENSNGIEQNNAVNQATGDRTINQESNGEHDALDEENLNLSNENLDHSNGFIQRLLGGRNRGSSSNQQNTGNDEEVRVESGNNSVVNQGPRLIGHISMDNGHNLEYNMNHSKRGKCLIFNHEKFDDDKPDRKGTEKDADQLSDCFETHGFTVVRLDDFSKEDLMSKCEQVSKEDHSNADCFVCCILTHGENDDSILNARDAKYNKRDVFEFFTADNCKSLAGKPKLFFIQACRAGRVDADSLVKFAQHDVDSGSDLIEGQHLKTVYIPIWADFLISYSTVEGQLSWRNVENGSLFVQALAPSLKHWGHQHDLLEILTYVTHLVNESSSDLAPGLNCKQVPQTIHLLTRRLIFRPKMNLAFRWTADINRA